MPSYSAKFDKGAASVAVLYELISAGSPLRRNKTYSWGVGCTAASNDGVHIYVVRRITNSGTGAAVTPSVIDLADAVCSCTSKDTITVDAASFSAGVELYREPLNGRASWQWNANPGRELVGPATATTGVAVGISAASTTTYSGNLAFEE